MNEYVILFYLQDNGFCHPLHLFLFHGIFWGQARGPTLAFKKKRFSVSVFLVLYCTSNCFFPWYVKLLLC